MVADENFFATLLKNSPLCRAHENTNLVHVQFDQWEHDKASHQVRANAAKCLMPNPNHCGRSPTVNTLEYFPVLQLADDLFIQFEDTKEDTLKKEAAIQVIVPRLRAALHFPDAELAVA